MEHNLEYPRMCKAWTKVEHTGNLSWLAILFSIHTHVIQILEAQLLNILSAICFSHHFISWSMRHHGPNRVLQIRQTSGSTTHISTHGFELAQVDVNVGSPWLETPGISG